MMAYLMYRCERGYNEEVEINFLTAGHTKFECDSAFGWLKKETRKTRLSSLADIEAVSISA